MKDIIVIPARGNSKGIRKKNLVTFCGKPLLYWTIAQAKKSRLKKNIYVSSENNEILKFATKMGVGTIKRPFNLSKDDSSSESAILHVINSIGFAVKNIVFLQATSPLRKPNDINQALEKFYKSKSDSLFSCHKAQDFFDVWAIRNKKYKPLIVDFNKRKPRQLYKEEQVCQNGSIYIFKNDIITKFNNRLGGKISVFKMEEWQSLQLDVMSQKKLMELIFLKELKKYYV